MFFWQHSSSPAFWTKASSLLWLIFLHRERQEALLNTLITRGFINTSNVNCPFFSGYSGGFLPSFPGQHTTKILKMDRSMSFFFKLEGQIHNMGKEKQHTTLLPWPKKPCQESNMEVENWENDSYRTTCIPQFEKRCLSMSRVKLQGKKSPWAVLC